MLDPKMKALQGIMAMADKHAFGGLKKKGAAPAAMMVSVDAKPAEGSPAEEAAESPAKEHAEQLTPEMIAALEAMLAEGNKGAK